MDVAVIVSTEDMAGMNIKSNLLGKGFDETGETFDAHRVFVRGSTRLFTTDKDTIHCEHIDKAIETDGFRPELLIFATRHQSASGIPSLSVHSPGNWSRAEFGGEDRTLCIAPARLLRFALFRLREEAEERHLDFDVIQECTHHGPHVMTPAMFIEIGSEVKAWQDPVAGDALASTIISLLDSMDSIPECRPALGIGGPHHTPAFMKVMENNDICFGHVCPKYMLEHLDRDSILRAVGKTEPKAEMVILDWKGLGQEKARLRQVLEGLDIPTERSVSLRD